LGRPIFTIGGESEHDVLAEKEGGKTPSSPSGLEEEKRRDLYAEEETGASVRIGREQNGRGKKRLKALLKGLGKTGGGHLLNGVGCRGKKRTNLK